jgi:hypothetical protein
MKCHHSNDCISILLFVYAASSVSSQDVKENKETPDSGKFLTVTVGISEDDGLRVIKLKRGRRSFLNYKVGTKEHKFLTKMVDEKTYLEALNLSVSILRKPPTTTDCEKIIQITLSLWGDELKEHGIAKSNCAFCYHPGRNDDVDRLKTLTDKILEEGKK